MQILLLKFSTKISNQKHALKTIKIEVNYRNNYYVYAEIFIEKRP